MSSFFSSLNTLASQAQTTFSSIGTQAQSTLSQLHNTNLQDIALNVQNSLSSGFDTIRQELSSLTEDDQPQPTDSPVLPWETDTQEKTILVQAAMEKVLHLSLTKETFTYGPSNETVFQYDFEKSIPVIPKLMEIDVNLKKMHAKLCPFMPEKIFWRNYFFHVALIRIEVGIDDDNLGLTQLELVPFNLQKIRTFPIGTKQNDEQKEKDDSLNMNQSDHEKNISINIIVGEKETKKKQNDETASDGSDEIVMVFQDHEMNEKNKIGQVFSETKETKKFDFSDEIDFDTTDADFIETNNENLEELEAEIERELARTN